MLHDTSCEGLYLLPSGHTAAQASLAKRLDCQARLGRQAQSNLWTFSVSCRVAEESLPSRPVRPSVTCQVDWGVALG